MAPGIRAEALPRPFGSYLLLEQLGTGATGEVYLAKPLAGSRALHTPVVIKRLLADRAEDPEFVKRFRHEARVAVLVDSPNVAGVFDVGSVDGDLYIAMEYVSGWTLTKVLLEAIEGRIEIPQSAAVEIAIDALNGLDALHGLVDEKGAPLDFVHRDISPRNLMIGTDGTVRIIDLGLGLSRVQSWQTQTGRVLGAVGYMPPEQIRGERVDRTSDLYAVGVVLYEMLSGRRLIAPGPLQEMMRAGIDVRPELPASVSAELSVIVQRALAPQASERYQSAASFIADLDAQFPAKARTGGARALIREVFAEEAEHLSEKLREVQGRIDSETHVSMGSDTEVVVFASGARLLEHEVFFFDTEDGLSDPTSGASTEPPQIMTDTMRLDLEEDRGPTVLIPTVSREEDEPEEPSEQARVITKVTPAPNVQLRYRMIIGLLLWVIGLLLGLGSRLASGA